MSLSDALAPHDRVPLGHWPTPIEHMNRLGQSLGLDHLYMKRDDCSGLGFGGNKVRKLEYLLGEAKALGAKTIITAGAIQSNHARQTAAACAKQGLMCHLVLPRMVTGKTDIYESSGNILLDHLFGAEVHIVNTADEALNTIGKLLSEIEGRGEKAYVIPPGGATAVGSLGFARAALELKQQEEALGQRFDRIVLAASTAGTLAGLAVGFAALDDLRQIDAVMVFEPSTEVRPKVEALIASTAAALGVSSPGLASITLHDAYLGPGYGQPTDAMREALSLTGTLEGIALDPAYTGKAMAGLVDLARRGDIKSDERVLFWHTGGAPALFAQPEAL